MQFHQTIKMCTHISLVSSDCYCSVALPNGVVGWPAVCDCGISLSYSLSIFF